MKKKIISYSRGFSVWKPVWNLRDTARVTSLGFVGIFICELPTNLNDFLEGKGFSAGKLHRTTRTIFEKCALWIYRKFVSARRLNFVNSETETTFQASCAIELTKWISLIGKRSEVADGFGQINWDTVASLKAETMAVYAKRIALISRARNGAPSH
jgi:hypothetical protein